MLKKHISSKKPVPKRFPFYCSILLVFLMICQLCVPCFAQETETEIEPKTQTSCGDYELDEFVNNEILAVYRNGNSEVFSCGSEDALRTQLEELSDDRDVSYVQPNFEYNTSGASVDDEFFSEQWALNNDGSFKMETGNNQFPVYDDPFDTPASPGNWYNPWPWFGGHFPVFWFGDSSQASSEGQAASQAAESSQSQAASQTAEPSQSQAASQASSGVSSVISAVSGIDINVEEAWNLYDGGSRETVIALIDTGVDMSHEDFGDVFWKNEDEIPGNGIDDDGNGYIDDVSGWNFYSNNNSVYVGSEDNHGTHGAGSIAASSGNSTGISGIVSDGLVKIMVLKALGGKDGRGTTDSVIKAIQYAQDNGAKICNLSMGTSGYDRALRQVMEESDMLFVVSAGNDGANADVNASYPACFDLDNIISVANLQPDGTLCDSSNYGAQSVDIAAPGTYILSLTSEDSYSYMTGTSMSAPIVSASAAMLYSYRRDLTISDVKAILMQTASPLSQLSGKVLSGGMLDIGSAMKYSQQYKTEKQNQPLPFNDISQQDDSYEAVKYLYENDIMVGTSDITFSPDTGLTRAMAITLLGRMAGAVQQDTESFSDVTNGTWYSGYVGWAVRNNIVVGYGNGLFGTEDPVTAEQLGLMLQRYAALLGIDYDSGLSADTVLTRIQTAQALYEFCIKTQKE